MFINRTPGPGAYELKPMSVGPKFT